MSDFTISSIHFIRWLKNFYFHLSKIETYKKTNGFACARYKWQLSGEHFFGYFYHSKIPVLSHS